MVSFPYGEGMLPPSADAIHAVKMAKHYDEDLASRSPIVWVFHAKRQ